MPGRSSRLLAVLAALALALGALCAPALAQEYVIGEGDLLHITVYDNPDLATDARVSGDGRITFPLIGEVMVSGLTATDAQRLIATRLQEGFVKKPQVSVFIAEYKSKKVTTLGEFVKPGLIELRGNATLMEVMSNAGGVTPNAGDVIVIKRKVLRPGGGPQEDETITLQLSAFLEGRTRDVNLMVAEGDSIYVPRASFVYVSGAVRTPGVYKITQGLTVLKSITLAGGFTARAAKNKTKIIRKGEGREATLAAQLEDLVQPDDVVVVPESLF